MLAFDLKMFISADVVCCLYGMLHRIVFDTHLTDHFVN